jgi:hypothetical protein
MAPRPDAEKPELRLIAALAAAGAGDLESVARVVGLHLGEIVKYQAGYLLAVSEGRGKLLDLRGRAAPGRVALSARELRRLSAVRTGAPPVPGLPRRRSAASRRRRTASTSSRSSTPQPAG